MNRLTAEERFCRDPLFANLVKICEQIIHHGDATPSELREAVTLAATRVEMRALRAVEPRVDLSKMTSDQIANYYVYRDKLETPPTPPTAPPAQDLKGPASR